MSSEVHTRTTAEPVCRGFWAGSPAPPAPTPITSDISHPHKRGGRLGRGRRTRKGTIPGSAARARFSPAPRHVITPPGPSSELRSETPRSSRGNTSRSPRPDRSVRQPCAPSRNSSAPSTADRPPGVARPRTRRATPCRSGPNAAPRAALASSTVDRRAAVIGADSAMTTRRAVSRSWMGEPNAATAARK